MTTQDEPVEIPLMFIGAEDVPILFSNIFTIQHQQNEFIITVGQVQPPLLLGSPEDRLEQAKRVPYVPIKVVARLALTRTRLVELIKALQENLQNYDQRPGEEQ